MSTSPQHDHGGVPATSEQLEQLQRYAELTYRTLTGQRRRVAAAALVVALVFGLLALLAGVRWADTNRQAAAVQDATLVEGLGLSIPDPRPAVERAELRLRAVVLGIAAVACGGTSLLAVGVWALMHPPAAPPPPG